LVAVRLADLPHRIDEFGHAVVLPFSGLWCCSPTIVGVAASSYADRGSAFPLTAASSASLSSAVSSDSASTTGSSADGAASLDALVFSMMRTIDRDRSGPTDVARISRVERRLPSRSSYSLV